MQRRLMQTKVCYKLFYSLSKEASHKPLKVAAAKKSFPSVFIIDTTCYNIDTTRWMFFIPCDYWKQYFSHKFNITQRLGATTMLLRSLKQVFWKKSAFYVRYLGSNITITMMLIAKVQNKTSTS